MTIESEDSPITPALLKKYKDTMRPARRIKGAEAVEIEGRPEGSLVTLVHSACNWPANRMAWGGEYIDALLSHIPLAEADPALIQNVGRNFTTTQAELEGSITSLTKGQVVNAFAAYYHLIQPSTDSARYVRSLIEEAFTVLELGPIPPAKYTGRLSADALRENLR